MDRETKAIEVIRIKSDKLTVQTTNLGCVIMKILVKDRDGKERDMVLGYDTAEEYRDPQEKGMYLGALVGRVANRIGGAAFELNGRIYQLAKNNGPNAIHGGVHGFSGKVFDFEHSENEVRFHYVSADGEEGYPGTLHLTATYRVEDDQLILHYEAQTDQDTIINLTNHSYFNLSGRPCDIGSHMLTVRADRFACVDENGLTSGTLRNVEGTPFDFREGKAIGEALKEECSDDQLALGHGLDHPFLFNGEKDQVTLYCLESGIEMTVHTTLPQAQIYTGNFLERHAGKGGQMIDRRYAVCVETQYMPDSIHLEKEPDVILRAGETYEETTTYRFRARK